MSGPPPFRIVPPPDDDEERQLVMGGYGAGKTTGYFSYALYTTGHFYVFDADKTTKRFLTSDKYRHLKDRMTTVVPIEWPDYPNYTKEWLRKATNNDWLVLDPGSDPWNSVQDHFCQVVYGKGREEMALEHRRDVIQKQGGKGSPNPFDGLLDYGGTINPMYRAWQGLLMKWPGHLYIATPASKIIEGVDKDKNILSVFGPLGVKPEGQKHLGMIVHSVLALSKGVKNKQDVYYLNNSAKDREREVVKGKMIDELALDYLVGVAGWKIEKR